MVLFELFSINAYGQYYRFKTIASEKGLEYTWVWNIYQDSNGYMWFSTQEGAFKFDGYDCVRLDENILSSKTVNFVFEDSQNRLWFGTNNGLNRYNRATETIKNYNFKQAFQKKHSQNNVHAIQEDNNGFLWIGTDWGLYKFDPASEEFTKYQEGDDISYVNSVSIDLEKNIWIGWGNGNISVLNPTRNDRTDFNTGRETKTPINAIYPSSDSNVWVGYEGAGAVCLNFKNGVVSSLMETSYNNKLSSNNVRSIVEDSKGSIWLGTEKGITIFDPLNNKSEFIFSDPYDINGLADNAIYHLYKDRNNNIWIGTFFNGVSLYKAAEDEFLVYKPNGTNNSIGGKAISQIFPTSKNIYIGTEDNGVSILNRSNQKFSIINQSNSKLSYNNIHSLLVDTDENLWIGTYTGGLNKAKLNTDGQYKISTYRSDKHQKNTLSSNSIYSLLEDSKGNIWIGTRGGGLNKYLKNSDTFQSIGADLIGGTFIWDMLEDFNGNIWIGTYYDGLYKLNTAHGYDIQKIDIDLKGIISLYETTDGKLLVGTEHSGMAIIDLMTDSVNLLSEATHLPDNTVYSFLEDEDFIWFSSNKGLHKSNKSFDNIETYTVADGLPTNRFNYNSAAKIENLLFFGTTNGLVIYDKNIEVKQYNPPNINLTYLKVFDDELKPNQKNINHVSAVELSPDNNSFTIGFVAMDFTDPANVEYAVKLENFESDWRSNENIRQVTYSKIPPGHYQFKIRTINNDTLLDNEKSLWITIQAHWWQTVWAKTLFIASFAAIVSFIISLILAKNKSNHALEIEKIEKEKIREMDAMRIRFFTDISHEFKTPLSLISGPIDYLNASDKISAPKKKWYYELIKKNADRLLLLINELIEFRNIESDQMNLNIGEVPLQMFMKEVLHYFDWIAETKRIQLTFKTQDPDTFINIDSTKFEKIISNIISNAFKFTPENGYIKIEHNIEERNHVFYFRNSGGQLSSQKALKIFDRFYTSPPPSADSIGSGIGLNYVKSLVELHNGSIEVENIQNIETCFIIRIPEKAQESGQLKKPALVPQIIERDGLKKIKALLKKNKPKILVVEDSKDLRDFITDYLTTSFEVLSASNGSEALEISKTFDPDMIISDLIMPKMNGYELCNKIKNDFSTSHILIILLTAHEEAEQKIKAYKSGADAYITKPIDMELLTSRVWNLIINSHNLKLKYQQDLNLAPEELTYSNPDEKLLKLVLETAHEHIRDPKLDVDYFAKKVGLSKSSLYRKMKVITGQSINEFIQTIRLKKAAQLLIESPLTISEIAYETGFTDPYYFSRVFKKQFKVPPTEYRSMHIIAQA